MRLFALRGAISVYRNDAQDILDATATLMRAIMERNALTPPDVVSCIFTATNDLNAEFPAAAARAIGQQVAIVEAGSESELDAAFAALAQRQVGALVVAADQFFTVRREQIIALTARYAMPAIYELREYVVAGGLMSYGTNLPEGYYQNGVYVGRILKGAKAADLPVVQSTKFEFVINLKTAKSLGIKISDNLLSLADEVIE